MKRLSLKILTSLKKFLAIIFETLSIYLINFATGILEYELPKAAFLLQLLTRLTKVVTFEEAFKDSKINRSTV